MPEPVIPEPDVPTQDPGETVDDPPVPGEPDYEVLD